ncbi:hypothetical protein AB4Y36_13180 [Paraburkholderia sp. BR10936]|uniref:hypothetical protein n=1 Tax=Paraburkholderia sp. BR10936 TaxID=3236993 RepID=UPI0034D2EA1F
MSSPATHFFVSGYRNFSKYCERASRSGRLQRREIWCIPQASFLSPRFNIDAMHHRVDHDEGDKKMVCTTDDLLVALLNIDAEIKACMERLSEVERGTDHHAAAWSTEIRTALRTDLVLMKERREEYFLRLNGVQPDPAPRSASSVSIDSRPARLSGARTCECL